MTRDQPHNAEPRASVVRAWEKGRPPRGLAELLRWFLLEWAAEVPTSIHAGGVWRDYVKAGDKGGGGSALGAPRYHDAFRAYLEGSAFQTDALAGEGERGAVYVRPVHAAFRIMGGNPNSDDAGIARFLFALACSGGDWRGILSSGAWSTPFPLQRHATEGALWRLWATYERSPREVAA